MSTECRIDALVWDFGMVLFDWNPRYLYTRLISDDEERESFLSRVCTPEWNDKLDSGMSYKKAERELIKRYPSQKELILAWRQNHLELIKGPIPKSVEILNRVDAIGLKQYGLTNWPETFPEVRQKYDFLNILAGIVVSSEEKIAKPDPRIFQIATNKFSVNPQRTLFIDDRETNIRAAQAAGFQAYLFRTPEMLENKLIRLGVLSPLSSAQNPAP
jgi:2-haloacid dehalogenase